MTLLYFWIKIILKRMINLLKSSPVTIIWSLVIIGSLIYAFMNNHIELNLDTRTKIVIMLSLLLYSIFKSIKNYNVIPVLIKYSKSKFNNRSIKIRYFLKLAFLNNFLLFVFAYVSYNAWVDKIYFYILFSTIVLSILLSFFIMYSKNQYSNKKIIKENKKMSIINPKVKSIFYDYVSSDFLLFAIICITVFIIIVVEIAKDINYLHEINNQSIFFIAMTVIFSVGFMGIIDSIPKINWKFQAIISSNSYNYHIKRSITILGIMYGWLLVPFSIIGFIINPILLIKYLYCIFVLFLISIQISFAISHMIIKGIKFSFIIALTIWISTLPVGFLALLLIPVILTYIKAKNEYREWSLL